MLFRLFLVLVQAPDTAESAQLDKMEEELDVEDITFFRSWAEGQMKVEVRQTSSA